MNKNLLLFLVILLINNFCVFPAFNVFNNEYGVKNIPKSLLADADAIVRKNEIVFEIKNESVAILKKKIAVTIFKKTEQDYGVLNLEYSKFNQIEELEGIIYDENGEEVRELEDRDIKDYPTFKGYSLYEDSRLKIAQLYYDRYPYTVEFYYEIYSNGYINWPEWYSQTTLDAVENSSFKVVTPSNHELRYWCNKDYLKPIITEDGKKTYLWEKKNLPKQSRDVIGDDLEDVSENVKIAPTHFVIEGYEGSMTSWKDFGLWYYNLAIDKNKLSEEAMKEITSLINSDDEVIEKIKKLYQFMQNRSRYVSVQLGIGGWQPFDAEYVYVKGYGDCKALSNFTISILGLANIKAYPVVINNGSQRLPLVSEFPSNQFNHVIVCIPLINDTIWLECTSQTIPFGHIGWSNENRNALMITEEGGIIVRTPVSKAYDNLLSKKISVEINENGKINTFAQLEWSGNQQDYLRKSLGEASLLEQEELISEMFEVPDLKVTNSQFIGLNDKKNNIKAILTLTLPRYASTSGSRLFFNPNLMERRSHVPKEVKERISPIRFSYPYVDIDSIYYSLPASYAVETMPKDISITTSFGKFIAETKVISDDKLLFVRNLEINTYSIPAQNYKEYRDFFKQVVTADRSQIVLVQKSK